MRPIVLKGHERPLTQIRFNKEGDVIYTVAKDSTPCAWWTKTGERMGTFNGHTGAVWTVDVDYFTKRLITGSSDTTARIWDCRTGTELFKLQHSAMVRSTKWSHGDQMVLVATDSSFKSQPAINIYNVADDPADQETEPVRSLQPLDLKSKMGTCVWGELNHTIISADDDGKIRVWDVEKGTQTNQIQAHSKKINDMQLSSDGSMLITASADQTCSVFDVKTLEKLKQFQSDRPLNGASIHPTMNHVILAGGQEAMNVTTTDMRVGHFEVDFYHIVYEQKLDAVKGHFGPVNTVAIADNGSIFASGGEDGYVRLYHFDDDYFNPSHNY